MYARVYFVHSRLSFFVPIRWIKGLRDYEHIDKTKEYICFYSNNPTAQPDFNVTLSRKFNHTESRIYKANVLKVFGRSSDSSSSDDSNDSRVHFLLPGEDATMNSDTMANNIQTENELIAEIEQVIDDSVESREKALNAMAQILIHRFLPHLIEDHKIKMINIIERSIRRGKPNEQALAAQLVPMLILQLGGGDDVAAALAPLLLSTAMNTARNNDVRSKCCSSLGLINFLGGDDIGDLIMLMTQLETIFSGSYLPADKKSNNINISHEDSILHCAALNAWGLLVTMIPAEHFFNLYTEQNGYTMPAITDLMGMLQSIHLNVRLTAGEVIAVLLECGRAHDQRFQEDYLTALVEAVRHLANDSNKMLAKRDRKMQRATFREIWRYLEENVPPSFVIRFGNESLHLDTWSSHYQYKALCAIIGPGLTSHISENELLRDLLHLDLDSDLTQQKNRTNEQQQQAQQPQSCSFQMANKSNSKLGKQMSLKGGSSGMQTRNLQKSNSFDNDKRSTVFV